MFLFGLITFIKDEVNTRCFLTDLKGDFIYELKNIYKPPGYQWDLGTYSGTFRHKLATHNKQIYDFTIPRVADLFLCKDFVQYFSTHGTLVVSTYTYPLPLIMRNSNLPYTFKSYFSETPQTMEYFEKLFIRLLLNPTDILKNRILEMRENFIAQAEAYRIENNLDQIILGGAQIRSEYVVSMSVPRGRSGHISSTQVEKSYKMYQQCLAQAMTLDEKDEP
eukprot:UN23693